MRAGQASKTAIFVSFGRGLGVERGGQDPTAVALLPRRAATALRLLLGAGPRGKALRLATRLASGGMVDHVTLRTGAIDAAIRSAVARKVPQLVILGAGLDGRAWRLAELGPVEVFEVDHPDTQANKRQVAELLELQAQAVRFVPVDFERDSLEQRLEASGHRSEQPTMWIWEGVTLYLGPEAITSTLEVVGRRSAMGSELAMTYAIPELIPGSSKPTAALARFFFSRLGEPLRPGMSRELVTKKLAAVGFELTSDTSSRDWANIGPGDPRLAFAFSGERLALASKTT